MNVLRNSRLEFQVSSSIVDTVRTLGWVGVFALLITSLSAAAQTREGGEVQKDEPSAQNAGPVMLTTILPPLLADFVKKYGQDRPLTTSVAQAREDLSKAEPQASKVIETIGPRGYFGVAGPVTIRSEYVRTKLLRRDNVRPVLLVAGTEVVRADKTKVKFGEEVALPRVRCDRGDLCEQTYVLSGLVLNGGTSGLTIEDATGTATLAPGEALYVIARELWEQSGDGTQGDGGIAASCGVSCGNGYYACCNNTTFWEGAKCKCIVSNASSSCNSGGPGASACSIAD